VVGSVQEDVANENFGGGDFNHIMKTSSDDGANIRSNPVDCHEASKSRCWDSMAHSSVRNKKRSSDSWVDSSARDGSGSDDGGEESNADGDSVGSEWRLVVVAARSKDAEGEEEKREHFSDQSDSRVASCIDVWEDSVWVERFELTGRLPKRNAESGASASSNELRNGIEDPLDGEVIVGCGNCLPSENSNGNSRVDMTSRNTSDGVNHGDEVARSANWHSDWGKSAIFSGSSGHRNGI